MYLWRQGRYHKTTGWLVTTTSLTWWLHWLIGTLWTTTWTTKKATFEFTYIWLFVMSWYLILWIATVLLFQVINYTQKYGSHWTYDTIKHETTTTQIGITLMTSTPILVFLLRTIWCKWKLVHQTMGWCVITWTLATIKYLTYTGSSWKL